MRTHRALDFVAIALVCLMFASLGHAQPVCEEQRIFPSDFTSMKDFGSGVSLSGDWALAGARGDPTFGTDSGAAYFFLFDGEQWVERQKVFAPDGHPGSFFGDAVAIQGDMAAIGARLHFHKDHDGRGAVYIFRNFGAEWVFVQEILPPDGSTYFGRALAMDGDRLVIAAVRAAWIYRFNGDEWVFEQKVPEEDPGPVLMANSIALSGDLLVLSAPFDPTYCDKGYFGAGKAYISRFDRTSGQWGELEELVPSITGCDRVFGDSVALSGSRAIVVGQEPRAAHVFEFDAAASAWSETAILVPPPGGAGGNFGRFPASTALDGDTAVVGAHSSSISGPSSGAAFVYQHTTTGKWIQRDVLLPHPEHTFSGFGRGVFIADGRVIVSAFLETSLSGAAYIHDLYPPVGDLTCDGKVGLHDVRLLLADWGHCPAPGEATTGCPGDLNGDGTVDVLDLLILLDNWG
jgi:hypothetical protein